jgi:hypothetical protein
VEGEGGVTEGLCGPGSQGPFGKGHSVQVRDLLETGHFNPSQGLLERYTQYRLGTLWRGPLFIDQGHFEERYLIITSWGPFGEGHSVQVETSWTGTLNTW